MSPLLEPESIDPATHAADERRLLHVWGTRGSIPSPGPGTVRFGGNTSCVSVRVGRRHLIFDAGSGIRKLGEQLAASAEPTRATIFLTHFHWDHIQGLPFFAPLYDGGAEIELVGPDQEDRDIDGLLSGQMAPPHFKIPLSRVPARLTFHDLGSDVWEGEGVLVRAMRVRHPSFTVGYRLDTPEGSMAYVPDNELASGQYDLRPGWRERFVEFLQGVDLLLHDAMFTERELTSRQGWGHSSFDQAMELAVEAGVGSLRFFHHAPGRSDRELDAIVQRYAEEARARGLAPLVAAAREGEDIPWGKELTPTSP